MKLSYTDYRETVEELFSAANISSPTLFWNPTDGFYINAAAELVPNPDLNLGLASYCAHSGARSFAGSRSEYQPIGAGIRKFYKKSPDDHRDINEFVEIATQDQDVLSVIEI